MQNPMSIKRMHLMRSLILIVSVVVSVGFSSSIGVFGAEIANEIANDGGDTFDVNVDALDFVINAQNSTNATE